MSAFFAKCKVMLTVAGVPRFRFNTLSGPRKQQLFPERGNGCREDILCFQKVVVMLKG
jgi:hypothetical protein